MHRWSNIFLPALVSMTLAAGCRDRANESSTTRTTSASPEERTGTGQGEMGQGRTVSAGSPQSANPSLSERDRNFVKDAVEASLTEIAAARYEVNSGANKDAKALGDTILSDHTTAYNDLQKLAAQKAITLPAQIEGEQLKTMQELTSLHGAQLDRKYAAAMVADHEKDIQKFKQAAKELDDPDLRAWAAKLVPILEGHLEKAKSVNQKLK